MSAKACDGVDALQRRSVDSVTAGYPWVEKAASDVPTRKKVKTSPAQRRPARCTRASQTRNANKGRTPGIVSTPGKVLGGTKVKVV